jgi:hypothetical protein
LPARLDEPEPGVDASGDLGEDVSRISVLQCARLLAGVAYMFGKGGERRRERIDVAIPTGTRKPIPLEAKYLPDQFHLTFTALEILHLNASVIAATGQVRPIRPLCHSDTLF